MEWFQWERHRVLLAALALVACGPDDPVVATADDGSTSDSIPSGDSSSSTTTEATTSSTGEETTGGTSTTGDDGSTGTPIPDPDPDPLPPPPARGIEIVDVTADQAVRVPIARGGELVGPTERNTPLFRDRAAVLRAFYELDPGFETRDIFAELTIVQLSGDTTTYGSFETVFAIDCGVEPLIDCRYASLPSSFFWKVPEEDMQPGATYSVALFETSPGHEDDPSEKSALFPTGGGSLPIGIEDSYLKMRVVLVPIDHDIAPDCPDPPDLYEEYGTDEDGNPRSVADFFAERLLAHNPADNVWYEIRDTVRFTGNLQNSSLLSTLQQLRFTDGAPPEYFYYAVARPCDGGPDFAGVAQLGGPTIGEAPNRVGWGVYYQSVTTTANTFVHEIGHEQGRRHIACSGEEGGPDPSYPDPDGDIANWGIDAHSTSLKVHDPDDHDYMTYCQSSWVSEWGYNLVHPWIAEMSSWDFGSVPAPEPLLVGNLRADGTQQWYVAHGYMPQARVSPSTRIRFTTAAGSVERVAAKTRWERSDDYNVLVPLAHALDELTAVEWIDAGARIQIDPEAIERLPGSGALAAP